MRTIATAACVAALLLFAAPDCFGQGRYHIGLDDAGMYFQTDRDGGWQIPKSDRKYFRVGEQGSYTKGKDASGSFVQIDGDRKFYVIPASKGGPSGTPNDSSSTESAAGKETKITIKGNQVLVPVTLGYGGKEVQVSAAARHRRHDHHPKPRFDQEVAGRVESEGQNDRSRRKNDRCGYRPVQLHQSRPAQAPEHACGRDRPFRLRPSITRGCSA